MPQAAALSSGTPSARPQGSPGVVADGCKWGRGPRLRPGLVRARRPRSQGASFHDLVAARAKTCRRLLAPYVIEGGPPLFRSIGVHSCLLVVRLHFKVRSPGSRRRDTPHRISLRLAARLLRLPLKGGVIAGTNREHSLHNSPGTVPFPVDRSGGDRRSCARPCAGGTPALPGSRHLMTSLFPFKGGSDVGYKPVTPFTQQTGNMVYTLLGYRARRRAQPP